MENRDNQRRLGAMYLRKSKADAERERIGRYETLAKHRAELTAMARRMGLAVDRVFEELKSGESIAARDQFRELMDGVGQRQYEYVICHAVDRLGRGDMMEYGWVLSTFQYSRTLIITPGKTYDPSDPFDLQQLQLQMFFSNAEYMRIKERFRAGKEASVREGQYIAPTAPMGYDKHVRQDRMKTLVPNEHAPVIRDIYRRVASGEPAGTIARDLNNRGILTARGREWSSSSIADKVRNPVYKGCVRWRYRYVAVDGRESDTMELHKRLVHSDDPIIVAGLHEAIVDDELWESANRALAPSPRVNTDYALRNPLAGVLFCGKCGRAMARYTNVRELADGSTAVYERFAHPPLYTCTCRAHSVQLVVSAVVDRLAEIASDYDARFEVSDGISSHEELLASLNSERARIERKRQRLVELYTGESIDIEEFGDLRAPLDDQLERIIAAIKEAEAFTPERSGEVSMSIRQALALLKDDSIPASIRNSAVKQIVSRIDYFDDGGGLELVVYIRESS